MKFCQLNWQVNDLGNEGKAQTMAPPQISHHLSPLYSFQYS